MELLWGEGGYTYRPYIPVESTTDMFPSNIPTCASISGMSWADYRFFDIGGPVKEALRPLLQDMVLPIQLDPFNGESLTVRHMAPEMRPYNMPKDYARYGGFLSSLTYLNTFLNPAYAGRAKENEVVHATTSGRCVHEASDIFATQVEGPDYLGSSTYGYNVLGEPTHTGSFSKPDFATANSGHYYPDLVCFLQILEEYGITTANPIYYGWQPNSDNLYRTWVRSFSYSITGNDISITYGGRLLIDGLRSPYKRFDGFFDVELLLQVDPRILDFGVGALYGTNLEERTLVAGTFTRHEVRTKDYATYDWAPVGSTCDYTVSWPLGMSIQSKNVGSSELASSSFISMANSLDQFVSFNRRSIESSVVVSSSNAVDEFRSYMDSNILESLSELHQVMDLIPDLKPIEDFLRLIPGGKLLSGLVKLVDFAANTYLLVQFGLKPFIADIQMFAYQFDLIAEQMKQRLGTGHDARGKLIYTFAPDTVFKDWTLITRSKVRIRIPAGSFAASLLPLSAAGLEPSSSQLWDLAMWSFAVDWFTKIGDKLNMGDNAVFLSSAIVDYCVHSYTLYTQLSEASLEATGLTPVDECQYKNYWRVPSRFYPNCMRNYAYDWWMGGEPPALIAGSLIWTVIRSR